MRRRRSGNEFGFALRRLILRWFGTREERLHAAIPRNGTSDCSPAFQAIFDAGFPIRLRRGVTYTMNSAVFSDENTWAMPMVVNANGATIHLGPGLPVVTSVLDGDTKFAFLVNIDRTSADSIALSESVRSTGDSGKFHGLTIENARVTTDNGADVGLVCTYTSAVNLKSVSMRGGRTALTSFGYTEPHRIDQCDFNSAGGANQIGDAWFIYNKTAGDGMTISGLKINGAVGGISLESTRGCVIDGLISGRMRLTECEGIVINSDHNESLFETFPVNIVISSSSVEFNGGVLYGPVAALADVTSVDDPLGMVNIIDGHNERASTVTFRGTTFTYFQHAAPADAALLPHIHFTYANPATVVNFVSVIYSLNAIGSANAGVWRRTAGIQFSIRQSSTVAMAPAAGLTSVYAKSLIASGTFKIINGSTTGSTNAYPTQVKAIPLDTSIVAQRALVAPNAISTYNKNDIGPGTLVDGTTYYYTGAFRNAVGQYTDHLTPVSAQAGPDRTMRLRISNPNGYAVLVLWRKDAPGVETTPDASVEIPIGNVVAFLFDTGTLVAGYPWITEGVPAPSVVAAANSTTAGILVDETAVPD